MKVVSHYEVATEYNEALLSCIMDDGSRWTCDLQGKNWRQQIPSDEQLTELFNKEQL